MELGSYLYTWAGDFRRRPNLLNRCGTFLTCIQSFLSFFSFPTQCHPVLSVHVNFPCVSGRFVMRRISAPSFLSFDRSFPPPHPPLLGEAGISTNDCYLVIYSIEVSNVVRLGLLFFLLLLLRGRWWVLESVGFSSGAFGSCRTGQNSDGGRQGQEPEPG